MGYENTSVISLCIFLSGQVRHYNVISPKQHNVFDKNYTTNYWLQLHLILLTIDTINTGKICWTIQTILQSQ